MESNPRADDELLAKLEGLIEQFANLHDHLLSERSALRADDRELLAAAIAAKQQALTEIHLQSKALGDLPLPEQIAMAPAATRAKLESRHSLLLQQATNAREYNTVNGKIIARSQQSLQALLQLISPGADDLIYGERGETSRVTGGNRFAQA